LKLLQFPVRLAFAMIINKLQGQLKEYMDWILKIHASHIVCGLLTRQ
jgi:hypothetical protein